MRWMLCCLVLLAACSSGRGRQVWNMDHAAQRDFIDRLHRCAESEPGCVADLIYVHINLDGEQAGYVGDAILRTYQTYGHGHFCDALGPYSHRIREHAYGVLVRELNIRSSGRLSRGLKL